jgi:hypothetical protein
MRIEAVCARYSEKAKRENMERPGSKDALYRELSGGRRTCFTPQPSDEEELSEGGKKGGKVRNREGF